MAQLQSADLHLRRGLELITIAPALNLNALWYLVDDRYLYAPSFGFWLAAAVALVGLYEAASSRSRKAVEIAAAEFFWLPAHLDMQTERYWYDDLTFFARCIEIDPSVADYRLKLAASLNQAGQPEAAARTYESAISLAPDDAHMHLMLARQYQTMGREMDFEREFQKFNELSSAKIMRQRAAEASGASQPADSPDGVDLDQAQRGNYLRRNTEIGRVPMSLENCTKRNFRFGLAALAALAFFALVLGYPSPVRAQANDGSADSASAPDQTDQSGGAQSAEAKAQADADQQAHDAADAAQEVLDNATQARDQLESDGASQDQIDAANQAIAQARANKDAADAAAQSADDAMNGQ